MIKKSFKFASNNPKLLQFLNKILTAEERAMYVPLEGKEVTLYQHYPYDLVTAILRGIKQVAKEKNPARFVPKQVYANYSMSADDMPRWTNLMNQAIALMSIKNAIKNYVIKEDDVIFQDLAQLVPWQMTRVQISVQPLVYRNAPHTPHTHRGAVLKYIGTDELEVASEDLSDIHFPRSRFRRPVEIAIFFFGYPNYVDEEFGVLGEEAQLQDQESRRFEDPSEKFHNEIRFPNAAGVSRSIKFAVARIHKNIGHLSGSEMIKLLALNGITSDHIVKAIKAMECDTCKRAIGPRAPIHPAHQVLRLLASFLTTYKLTSCMCAASRRRIIQSCASYAKLRICIQLSV